MEWRESKIVEFKKSTSELKEAVISISAILNKHQKGELYFGVKNDGEVVGQMIGSNTLRDISQAISSHIEPKIYPSIDTVNIKGRSCIKMEDYVSEDDPVREYDAFVEALNFNEIGIVLNNNKIGNPQYDPKAMLK
ncbi:MAG: RNA-binding domain-containing protein, partial [Candidatus Firestonebacteria bacterium]